MKTLYKQTKEVFLGSVRSLGRTHKLTTFTYPHFDPQKEKLTTEYLTIGNPEAKKWLVITSGTIGPDFYIGSSIQSRMIYKMNKGLVKVPDDVAILMVHGINSWGAAWIRPGNINNVILDMNFTQNFQELIAKEQKNEEYKKLNSVYKYCEKVINTIGIKNYFYHWLKMSFYYLKYGRNVVYKSIFTPQRSELIGLSYGGQKEQLNNIQLKAQVKQIIPEDASIVFHIDLQTSPGSKFKNSIIITEDSASTETFSDITCLRVNERSPGACPSKIITGLKNGSSKWKCAVYSIGTYSRRMRFVAMRDENILHNQNIWVENWTRDECAHIPINDYCNHKYKKNLLERFYPANKRWRYTVSERGTKFLEDLLIYLSKK